MLIGSPYGPFGDGGVGGNISTFGMIGDQNVVIGKIRIQQSRTRGSVVSIAEVKNGSTFNLSSQAFQDNDYVLLEGLMSADSDGVDGVIGHVKLVSENQIQIYADVGASSLRPSGGFATRIITEYSSSQEIQAIESITSDGFTAQNIGLFPVGGTVILAVSYTHLTLPTNSLV